MGILQRIRSWFLRHQPAEIPSDPAIEYLLHYSLDGRSTACRFGDGIFRWTVELDAVNCPICRERVRNMQLHNEVTVR